MFDSWYVLSVLVFVLVLLLLIFLLVCCEYIQEELTLFIYFLQETCLEKKFVVFDSEIDLAGHMIQMHPNRPAKRQIQVSPYM